MGVCHYVAANPANRHSTQSVFTGGQRGHYIVTEMSHFLDRCHHLGRFLTEMSHFLDRCHHAGTIFRVIHPAQMPGMQSGVPGGLRSLRSLRPLPPLLEHFRQEQAPPEISNNRRAPPPILVRGCTSPPAPHSAFPACEAFSARPDPAAAKSALFAPADRLQPCGGDVLPRFCSRRGVIFPPAGRRHPLGALSVLFKADVAMMAGL